MVSDTASVSDTLPTGCTSMVSDTASVSDTLPTGCTSMVSDTGSVSDTLQSEHEPRVEHPRLVRVRPVGRQAGDLVVRLEGWKQRRADERMRKTRVPPAAGCVRRELGRRAAKEAADRFDRTADRAVSLFVQRAGLLEPVRGRIGAVREEGARAGGIAPLDLHVPLERIVAELRQPESVLL